MSGQPINATNISPFAGEPATTLRWDDRGVMTFTVTPEEMTPDGIQSYEALVSTVFLVPFFGGVILWFVFRAVLSPWLLLAVLAAAIAMMWIFSGRIYAMMLTRTEVIFTPTEFRVRQTGGWAVYDRTLSHRFVMLRHDRTREEEEEREMRARKAAQRGKIINPPRYYADSFHIVFEYLGHRHDVLDVYDKNRALAVLARLKACDEVMDNHARMGEGAVLSPDQQWGEQPGGLPT